MSMLSIVIPAYNEENGIVEIMERVLKVRADLVKAGVQEMELLVVNDGSRDRTAEVANQVALRNPCVRVISHPKNRGYGAALKTGFAAAGGEMVGFLDADGTYPPEFFPQLCQQIMAGSDLVIGSRMAGAESKMPLTRRVGNVIFANLLNLLGWQRVTDSASGMRVFKREVLKKLSPLPDGLNLTPVMSTRAVHEGIRMTEVAIPYSERVGRSKLSVVRDGRIFLQSMVWTVMGYNPVRILGGLGLMGVVLALLIGLGLVVARLSGVTSLGPWGVVALFSALVLGVAGVSVFALGATFNYLVSLFYDTPIRQGLFGKPIFKTPLESQFGWMGLASFGAGLFVGLVSLILGVSGWEISRLWFYLLGGAMLTLIGIQLVIYWLLMRILEELNVRDQRVEADTMRLNVTGLEGVINMDEKNTPREFKNLGAARIARLRDSNFPDADEIVRKGFEEAPRSPDAVDVLLVNPPSPDGGIWIRSQHRVGRRSRENMVWPQVELAQMAAMLRDAYKFKVIDAIGLRLSWPEFRKLLDQYQPKYYLTQVTAPTLENDLYGTFLAKNRGAKTIAFGTHVTPIPVETLRNGSTLDFVLYGEPDLTIRDLVDHFEGKTDQRPPEIQVMFDKEMGYKPSIVDGKVDLNGIRGLAWRKGEEIIKNMPRPFIADLDDMPIPAHELLPLETYKMPMMKGNFTFIVTSRGCTAGCTYCIKHVSYQYSVRVRSPEKIVEELWTLSKLGIHNIHMYADLFTVSRDQVVGMCKLIIEQGLKVRWTCNSRVDYVDEEMLNLMAKAGCWYISWGIESGNEQILKHARKGTYPERASHSLMLAHKAGINNWGYFIIGLPGETETTIRETIDFAKKLPLDIALFHIAAPYPGTPFFFEVVNEGWFRKGTRWEQVDMDKETVLDYPGLPRERLMYWQKRAFREWALRPKPAFTYLKMLLSDSSTFKIALDVGLQTLRWQVRES